MAVIGELCFFSSCPSVCLCVCVYVCLSEPSSPSCFANFVSWQNRLSPRMLNTEWPWFWPQRSWSASVFVSVQTVEEGELRQFYVFWFNFFTQPLSYPVSVMVNFFPKMNEIDPKVKVMKRTETPCGFFARRSCTTYWGGFFLLLSVYLSAFVCVSETSSPSCFANCACSNTFCGRHNCFSPMMLITEWPWIWPQTSRSASVCVSVRTVGEGEIRQFCVFWSIFLYTVTLKPHDCHGQLSFPN